MAGRKIRWGLLGAGVILNRWMQGALQVDDMEICAVSSRTERSARAMAEKWNIPQVMTFEEMLDCGDIDVVYVPVPHDAHKELAIRAMNAGKHVLVEKPAAVCAEDFRQMSECARSNGVFLMEACWTYFFPAIGFVRKCIEEGTIGEVRALNCAFSFRVPDEYEGRLTRPENAGGGLLDVGVYDLHMAQIVYGRDPVSIRGTASINTDHLHLMVDEQAAFIAQYDRGELAVMSSGIRTDMLDTAFIYGTEGYITVPRFWSPDRVQVTREGETAEYSFPVEQKVQGLKDEGYQYEIRHVNDCIRKGLTQSPVVTHARTLSVLSQCDSLRKDWHLA